MLPREKQFPETLGQYLRRERESRNMTPEGLSKVTRIGLSFLKALEENDFDFFPEQQFIPGFLKAYCRYLELDTEQVLQRYYVQAEKNRQEKAFQQLPLFLDSTIPSKQAASPKQPSRKPVRLIILAVVLWAVLGLAAYLYLIPLVSKNGQVPASRPSALNNFQDPAEQATDGQTTVSERRENAPQENSSSPMASPSQTPLEINPKVDPQSKGNEKITGQIETAEKKTPKVIANRDSKLYHIPGMKYYNRVQAHHRLKFESEEEAIRAGYRKAPQ